MNIKKIIWKISILIPESKLKEKIRDIIYIDLLKKNIYFLLKKNKLLIGLKNKEKIKVLLKKESVMHDYNSISGYLKEYIPNKGEVVVDAGAYDGTISLIFSKLVKEKGKVIAFEPDPINFNKLVQKIKNNRLKNIIPINKALYSKNGRFKLNNLGTESSKLSSKNNEKTIIVPIVKLDDELKRLNINKVNFIKMDIEGSEIEALKGSKETLLNNNIHLAIASYHIINNKQTYIELEQILRKLKYKTKTEFPQHLTTYAYKK